MQINFNSRPSARGDWLDVGFNVTRPNISIHAPPRGATQRPPRPALAIPFQFTPLREGRPSRQQKRQPPARFQFTPLREGRHGRHCGRPRKHDFNSRPSARGDLTLGQKALKTGAISIHAPPRGATYFSDSTDIEQLFQFTPLREGRRASKALRRAATEDFNSRPSARGDAENEDTEPKPSISIHAPPRGATIC